MTVTNAWADPVCGVNVVRWPSGSGDPEFPPPGGTQDRAPVHGKSTHIGYISYKLPWAPLAKWFRQQTHLGPPLAWYAKEKRLLPNNRTPFASKSNKSMPKRDHCSEDTKISKYPKTISEIQYGSRADNLDYKTPSLRWWLAVRINSRKRWHSGCMQGGTRLMDSKRTSIAWGLSQSDRLGPSVFSIYVYAPTLRLNKHNISYNTHNVHRDGKCYQQFDKKPTYNVDINKVQA